MSHVVFIFDDPGVALRVAAWVGPAVEAIVVKLSAERTINLETGSFEEAHLARLAEEVPAPGSAIVVAAENATKVRSAMGSHHRPTREQVLDVAASGDTLGKHDCLHGNEPTDS